MTFPLPPELTIAQAAPLKQRLLDALRTGGPVLLDARAVTAVDAAGLQLLQAAHRSALASGQVLAFADGVRGAVIEKAVEEAGLAPGRGDRGPSLWGERS